MDQRLERAHLEKAEADIAGGRERIRRQEELIIHLKRDGHDVSTAQSILETMRETLQVMEQHRALILEQLASTNERPR